MNENIAKETIKKILQDPLLKDGKKKVFIKLVYPTSAHTLRNYMLVLLTKKTYFVGDNLVDAFVINLAKELSKFIGIAENSYIIKPTMADYFEMSSSYRRYKKRQFMADYLTRMH